MDVGESDWLQVCGRSYVRSDFSGSEGRILSIPRPRGEFARLKREREATGDLSQTLLRRVQYGATHPEANSE